MKINDNVTTEQFFTNKEYRGDDMKEEWKDVKDYEGLYQVSNLGRVKSVERMKWSGLNGGCYVTVPERILKTIKDKYGYLTVNLCKDSKMKTYKVHRLVATAFLDNPNNLPMINHKNEIKSDNHVDNLEWCDASYNANYGTRNQRVGEKVAEKLRGRNLSEEHKKKISERMRGRKLPEEQIKNMSKPVFSVDRETGLIMWWASAMEAERITGIYHGSIIRCCRGERKSAGGFYWLYADEDDDTE